MAMEQLPAKRARVEELLYATRGASSSAVSRLLSQVRLQPEVLEDVGSRWSLARVCSSVADEVRCRDIVLPTKDGGNFVWEVFSFKKMLQVFARDFPNFRKLIQHAIVSRNGTPGQRLRLALYADEVVPGDVLRPENKRKTMCVYLTIREFGRHLQHEAAWFPIAFLRAAVAKNLVGGYSAAFAALFKRLLLEEGNVRDGILVNCGSAAKILFFEMSNVVVDSIAAQQLWSWRGPNSLLPCFLCANVCQSGDLSLVGHESGDKWLVEVCELDTSTFQLQASKDVWEKADHLSMLAAAHGTKDAFEVAQQSTGLTYNASGVLWDKALRDVLSPMEVHSVGAAHTLVIDGIVNREMSFLLERLGCLKPPVTFAHIRLAFEADWHFPQVWKNSRDAIVGCFSEQREKHFKRSKHFAAGGSEMLSLVPAMVFFLDNLPEAVLHKIAKEAACLRSCSEMLRAYKLLRLGWDVHGSFGALLLSHARLYSEAYKDEGRAFSSKFHAQFHLQPMRGERLIDEFVPERKNAMAKAAMTDVKNTRCFERSVLSRALILHRAQLQRTSFVNALGSEHPCPELAHELGVGEAFIDVHVTIEGLHISHGDVVYAKDIVFYAVGFARVGSEFLMLAHPCVALEVVASSALRYSVAAEWGLYKLQGVAIKLPSMWTFEADGSLVVLR